MWRCLLRKNDLCKLTVWHLDFDRFYEIPVTTYYPKNLTGPTDVGSLARQIRTMMFYSRHTPGSRQSPDSRENSLCKSHMARLRRASKMSVSKRWRHEMAGWEICPTIATWWTGSAWASLTDARKEFRQSYKNTGKWQPRMRSNKIDKSLVRQSRINKSLNQWNAQN